MFYGFFQHVVLRLALTLRFSLNKIVAHSSIYFEYDIFGTQIEIIAESNTCTNAEKPQI